MPEYYKEYCPLCGGEVAEQPGDQEYKFRYGCTKCYFSAYADTLKEAIDIWDGLVTKARDIRNENLGR